MDPSLNWWIVRLIWMAMGAGLVLLAQAAVKSRALTYDLDAQEEWQRKQFEQRQAELANLRAAGM